VIHHRGTEIAEEKSVRFWNSPDRAAVPQIEISHGSVLSNDVTKRRVKIPGHAFQRRREHAFAMKFGDRPNAQNVDERNDDQGDEGGAPRSFAVVVHVAGFYRSFGRARTREISRIVGKSERKRGLESKWLIGLLWCPVSFIPVSKVSHQPLLHSSALPFCQVAGFQKDVEARSYDGRVAARFLLCMEEG